MNVVVAADPAIRGRTVIDLSPFGSIEARTHASPVRVTMSLSSIDLARLGGSVSDPPDEKQVLAEVSAAAREAAPWFVTKSALLGLAGSGIVVGMFRAKRRRAMLSLAGGALLPVVMIGATAVTYEVGRFSEPTLSGPISAAPEFLGPVEELGERFEELRGNVEEMSAAVFRIYRVLNSESPVPDDAVRILHIGDLHLNPIGYDVTTSVASAFKVHAVLDSGDTTAQGSAFEVSFLQPAGRLDVPYVWVRGNHDSAEIQTAVASLPNARVLDGTTTEVRGLTIFGSGDPIFTPGRSVDLDSREQQEAKERAAPEVLEKIEALPARPDIVLLHDETVGSLLAGRVPLVLSAHIHKFKRRSDDGTLFLTVGSTGAAGIESIGSAEGASNELQVLYFAPGTWSLVAVDRITVKGMPARFSLSRMVVSPQVEISPP